MMNNPHIQHATILKPRFLDEQQFRLFGVLVLASLVFGMLVAGRNISFPDWFLTLEMFNTSNE